MRKMVLVGLALSASVLATTANAAVITYTFTGDFAGTVDNNPFSAPAVFTAVGDTDTLSTSGLTRFVNLSSVSAVSAGVTYTLSTTTQFYLNGGNYAGLFFGSAGNGGGGFSGTGPGLAGYNAVSNLATTPLNAYFTGPVSFQTDRGAVTLSNFSNGTFGAVVAGAVPEPTTWAMMLIGFGMIGAAVRYRRRNTKIAYA